MVITPLIQIDGHLIPVILCSLLLNTRTVISNQIKNSCIESAFNICPIQLDNQRNKTNNTSEKDNLPVGHKTIIALHRESCFTKLQEEHTFMKINEHKKMLFFKRQ